MARPLQTPLSGASAMIHEGVARVREASLQSDHPQIVVQIAVRADCCVQIGPLAKRSFTVEVPNFFLR